MRRILKLIAMPFLILSFLFAESVVAQKSISSGSHKSTYSNSAQRDSKGRIKRSESAREQFMRQTGYPHGRPGYVIDHIVPLANGGADSPSNMQWQTVSEAKAKDKWERGQSSGRTTKTYNSSLPRSGPEHSGVSSQRKEVQVKSYTTKRGTTVRSHTRSYPGTTSRRSTSSSRHK